MLQYMGHWGAISIYTGPLPDIGALILMKRQGRTDAMTTNWTNKNPKALLKLACLFTLFLSSSVVAQSNVEFLLSCKVMDSIVMEAVEGRPQRYTHYTDQFEVGDTLDVSVRLNKFDTDVFKLYLGLKDSLRDEIIVSSLFSLEDIRYLGVGVADLLMQDSSIRLGFGIGGDESIRFEGTREKLNLTRYYKDDWQGLLLVDNALEVQVAILDCRVSGRNNLAEITDRLKANVRKFGE
jgi:hypothetical protein